jgi:lipoprotein-anchoring transpeptidase ErfK/SrfK
MHIRWLTFFILLLPVCASAEVPWVLVDTGRQIVSVIRDGETVLKLPDISIGRGGTSKFRQAQDDRTPLGIYQVAWIQKDSPFRLFFGLNYPTREQAIAGFEHGVIDGATLDTIIQAIDHGRLPPQSTALGGHIGIHGLGDGELWVHQRFNWTKGCIALTNQQVEQLRQWIVIGTRVVVR